jgi:hypothetical protein
LKKKKKKKKKKLKLPGVGRGCTSGNSGPGSTGIGPQPPNKDIPAETPFEKKERKLFIYSCGVGRGTQALHGAQFLRSCCCCIIIALVVHQAGGAHQACAWFVFFSLSLATTKRKRKESKQAKHTHTHTHTHRGEIISLQAFAPCSSSITKSFTKFLGALYLLTSRLKTTVKFWISQPEEV